MRRRYLNSILNQDNLDLGDLPLSRPSVIDFDMIIQLQQSSTPRPIGIRDQT